MPVKTKMVGKLGRRYAGKAKMMAMPVKAEMVMKAKMTLRW